MMASAVQGSGVGLNWASLKVLYISGVPYDAVHGLGTAFSAPCWGRRCWRRWSG